MTVIDEQPAIAGSTTITFRDQAMAFYWSARWLWWSLATCIFIFYFFQWLSPSDGGDSGGTIFSPVVIFGLAIVLWIALLGFGFWRFSSAQKSVSYRVTPEQVITSDRAGAAIIIPWSGIKRCRESRSAFILRLRPAGTRWLPKRAFAADAVDALRALIAKQLGDRAALRR